MALESFWLFITVSFLISATPGPVMVSAMTQGARVGVGAAHWGMLGATFGHIILVSIAAMGIGWLAGELPSWFRALQWIGAGYLTWLGLKTWYIGAEQSVEVKRELVPSRHLFLQSLGVACSNPKGIIYFATVLPPFVAMDRPLIPQLVLLTVAFAAIDYLWMLIYAVAGQVIIQRFSGLWVWFNRCAGVFFILVGVWLFYDSFN